MVSSFMRREKLRESEKGEGKKIQRKIIADLHLLLKSHLLSD